MKKTFTVYGSCVTRDVFNFLDNEIYVPELSIGNNSIPSLFGKGLLVRSEDIQVGTNYVNRMIYNNLTKRSLDAIKNKSSDFFVFDLAAERLPLQQWTLDDITIEMPNTWNIYKASKVLQEKYSNLQITNWHLSDQNKEKYKEELIRFSDELKQLYKQENIIYISLQQIDELLDDDYSDICSLTIRKNKFSEGIESRGFRERQNKIIKFAEQIVLQEIPNCWVIPMPNFVLGNSRHHFGTHPLHFDYMFYEYCAEALKIIVKERSCEVDRKVVYKNINFLCKRYEEKFLKVKNKFSCPQKQSIQFLGTSAYRSIFAETKNASIEDSICDTSISSIMSSPVSIYRNDIQNIISEDDSIHLLNDVKKTNKEILLYNNSKWILVDLLSECYSQIVVGGDKIIMGEYGDEFNSILVKKYPAEVIEFREFNSNFEQFALNDLEHFILEVLSKYDKKKRL